MAKRSTKLQTVDQWELEDAYGSKWRVDITLEKTETEALFVAHEPRFEGGTIRRTDFNELKRYVTHLVRQYKPEMSSEWSLVTLCWRCNRPIYSNNKDVLYCEVRNSMPNPVHYECIDWEVANNNEMEKEDG